MGLGFIICLDLPPTGLSHKRAYNFASGLVP
jgi:hypothetical protein